MDSVDDLGQDAHRFFNFQRQVGKQQLAKVQYSAKRKQDNEQREIRGEEPLPDEDINKIFKPLQPPARLESLLTSSQIELYSAEINNFATHSFGKLFIADQFQDTDSIVQP